MSDYVQQLIKKQADKIRAEICPDGMIAELFGEPFDPNNPDHVLVAAVGRAEQKALQDKLKELQFYSDMGLW
jgi:hypothetical protein